MLALPPDESQRMRLALLSDESPGMRLALPLDESLGMRLALLPNESPGMRETAEEKKRRKGSGVLQILHFKCQ